MDTKTNATTTKKTTNNIKEEKIMNETTNTPEIAITTIASQPNDTIDLEEASADTTTAQTTDTKTYSTPKIDIKPWIAPSEKKVKYMLTMAATYGVHLKLDGITPKKEFDNKTADGIIDWMSKNITSGKFTKVMYPNYKAYSNACLEAARAFQKLYGNGIDPRFTTEGSGIWDFQPKAKDPTNR